jgi:hypothetical protein
MQIIIALTTENRHFLERVKLMKSIFEGGENVNAAGELPTRSPYSEYWNVLGKYESGSLGMLRVIRSLI